MLVIQIKRDKIEFQKRDRVLPFAAHVPSKFDQGGMIESFDLDKIGIVYMACEEQQYF